MSLSYRLIKSIYHSTNPLKRLSTRWQPWTCTEPTCGFEQAAFVETPVKTTFCVMHCLINYISSAWHHREPSSRTLLNSVLAPLHLSFFFPSFPTSTACQLNAEEHTRSPRAKITASASAASWGLIQWHGTNWCGFTMAASGMAVRRDIALPPPPPTPSFFISQKGRWVEFLLKPFAPS